MGIMQSVVEFFALQPPPRRSDSAAYINALCQQYTVDKAVVHARYSKIPIYVLRGNDRPGAAAAAATAVEDAASQMWIIMSHGTSEDCSAAIAGAYHLATLTNTVVVLYEYPGYGASTPSILGNSEEVPSEAGMYAAAHAAYTYVTVDCNVSPDRIVVMGYSIGSGPTLELAATRNVAGAIVQAPFRSVIRTRCCTPWSLSCDIFHNEDRARRLPDNVRVQVMHGRNDKVVPVQHGEFLQAIFEARGNAHDSSIWTPDRGHTDLMLERDYIQVIRTFLQTVRDNAAGLQPAHLRDRRADVAVRLVTAPKTGRVNKEA
jgi:hypothetical protein